MWLVQGPVGIVMADHPTRPHRGGIRPRSQGGQARIRRDDDHEKNRHRRDRGGTTGLNPILKLMSVSRTLSSAQL